LSARYDSLTGRAVFVTGGASGIGEAFVTAFAAQGARVAFVDVREDAGRALAAKTGAHFGRCDVTEPGALAAALEQAARTTGAIGVLINNVANDMRHDAMSLDETAWRGALAVNLDPVIAAARAVQPGMKDAGGGVIINLSSINALLGPPDMAAYVAAKAAILGLTKSLAREWGRHFIRVNAISPGWVATARQRQTWLTPEAERAWMEQVALKREILPADVAALALFLASDDAAMITGQNFIIDGGRT
jgi:NAD(P)-dependent dehydrogenase (short-subunit alcohol dehydrogenase family)